jgi:hypothetical protein
VTQQKAGTEGPWLYDRRVMWLLELTIDEDEHVRFGIEGMDGQLIIALDERLLVIKPGFVRGGSPALRRRASVPATGRTSAVRWRASVTATSPA